MNNTDTPEEISALLRIKSVDFNDQKADSTFYIVYFWCIVEYQAYKQNDLATSTASGSYDSLVTQLAMQPPKH